MLLFTACVDMLFFRPKIDYATPFNLKYTKMYLHLIHHWGFLDEYRVLQTPSKLKNGSNIVLNTPPYLKQHYFSWVPRLRPFARLVNTTCRWRWAWSIGGTIMTRENWDTWRKIISRVNWPPKILTSIYLGSSPASAVRGQQLTAWVMAQPQWSHGHNNIILNTESVPRSKHTPSRIYKPVS